MVVLNVGVACRRSESESDLHVGIESECQNKIQNEVEGLDYANYILDFEIQILGPKHVRILWNGHWEASKWAGPRENESRLGSGTTHFGVCGYFEKNKNKNLGYILKKHVKNVRLLNFPYLINKGTTLINLMYNHITTP